MIKVLLFDLSRTILFAKNKKYVGELNALHNRLSVDKDYRFLEHFWLDEKLLEFLETLKGKYQLYIFTSGHIQDAPEIRSRLDEVFKGIFSADLLGLGKKDPSSYKEISRKIGVSPSEILFIDDMNQNTEAASLAGMNTLVYRGLEGLQNKINSLP